MLEGGDASFLEDDDLHVFSTMVGFHVFDPQLTHRLIGRMPRLPLRLFSELGRGLPDGLLEGAREGFVALVPARQRDVDDSAVVAERELVRGAPQTNELDVFVDADPEELRELPVEVILRERRDAAQPVDGQVLVQVRVDVLEHPAEPDAVGVSGGGQ